MNLINVDESKCTRDGLCVKACPTAILKLKDKAAVPSAVADAEALCIRCGHCVAVCPVGALSHRDMDVGDCPSIIKERISGEDQVEQLLRTRRSIRSYKQKEAPREILARLIDLAHYAPTAHNYQEVEWLVISGQARVKSFAQHTIDYFRKVLQEDPETAKQRHYDMILYAWDVGFDAICRSAPHLIFAHVDCEASPLGKYNVIDCATALSYMELAAPSLGLGTCWNGMMLTAIEEWPPLQKALALPRGSRCFGVLMVGYPQFKYRRMPSRRTPRVIWR